MSDREKLDEIMTAIQRLYAAVLATDEEGEAAVEALPTELNEAIADVVRFAIA
jgi:hypothetical protein